MQYSLVAVFLAGLPALTAAWNAPKYDNYSLVWQDNFKGASGDSPNSSNWNVITGFLGLNEELETYSSARDNLQLSGGNTLQLVPQKDSDGSWTSGRVESKYTFTPAPGAKTFSEADIRFGDDPIDNKHGIWPAFWHLGDSGRTSGTQWPACGEIDALETVDGLLTGYGTVHCDVEGGGHCKEPTGIQSSVTIPDQSWHQWRVEWDRTSNNWETESIKWYLDGEVFDTVTGAEVADESSWAALAHSPLYFILNVAVGGTWPVPPDSETRGGFGSMMEVAYVAVYTSS